MDFSGKISFVAKLLQGLQDRQRIGVAESDRLTIGIGKMDVTDAGEIFR